MGLDTKEKRMEARKYYYSEGMTVVDMPEIQFQAYLGENPPTMATFKGTAGKPYQNYRYRSVEQRDAALQNAIASQKRQLEYKSQRKAENKGNLTGSAATAKAIKARLKKEFPGVKFSVTSDNFSMGNSVDINWTDGPLFEQVDAITRQYQYGHFDGMTDSYEYRDINSSLGCPGAKYVHCNRKLSPEYKAQLQEVLEREFTPYHGDNHFAPFQYAEAEKVILGIAQEPEELPEVVEAQKEVIPSVSNVIDFTARLRAKQEQQEADDLINRFTTDYLPYMTAEDKDLFSSAPDDATRSLAMMLICAKIDRQRSRG